MKGLEGVPIKLLLVIFLLAIVVSVAYYQISFFMHFKGEKDFKSEVTDIIQKMKVIKSTGDMGSFTTVEVTVPGSAVIEINLDGDNITAGDYTAGLSGLYLNITAARFAGGVVRSGPVYLTSGQYSLRLYYGALPDSEIKPFTMLFE